MSEMSRRDGERAPELRRFYALLDRLAERCGGARLLAECNGRLDWPRRGVYFFFETGEMRSGSGNGPRVVRVGTHSLTARSRTTLWNWLSQHRGVASHGGGNHRSSIFRLLVGAALMRRHAELRIESWGGEASAPAAVRAAEKALERKVSEIIGTMPFIWLAIDAPSAEWLGAYCDRERVRESGLWNNDHVDETPDSAFLDLMERVIDGSAESVPVWRTDPRLRRVGAAPRAITNTSRLLAALERYGALDDDVLSRRSGVRPRQQVNQICRRLATMG